MAPESPLSVRFAGSRGRGRRRAAVLALEGTAASELASARAYAATFDDDPLLIAVDGGLAAFRASRTKPDLFVGDLDSTPVRPRGVTSEIYPVEKDFSDFAGALAAASRRRATVVVVSGLLGGRLDHEWANVRELGAAAKRFAGLLAPTSRGLLAVSAHGVRVAIPAGRIVSVFALGGPARVSLSGTRWTLSRRRVPPGSLGLSNVTEGDVALDVHAGVAGLVFPRGSR